MTANNTKNTGAAAAVVVEDPKARVDAWAEWEAYLFNHGSSWAFFTILLCFNVAMAAWGAWEFLAPWWTTENDILRVTLPIARAAGRLVTWNAALILLSGCKSWWTLLRASPLAYGFPIDHVMPYYHKVIAYTIIVSGCVLHTIPQIVNYATETLTITHNGLIWTDDDTIPTGQLFYTGVLLVVVFALFGVTTLEQVRRTALGFRIFWWVHVVCIACVIPLLILHGTLRGTPFTVYFLVGPLVLYMADVVFRRCRNAYQSDETTILELQACGGEGDENVTKLVIESAEFVYQAGQYAEIKIPQLSGSEWHPFTIASAPHTTTTTDKRTKGSKQQPPSNATATTTPRATFYIKACGRWTHALYQLAKEQRGQTVERIPIRTRGPFGAPAQNYFGYQHIIVIGSGIGVTPLLSVWQHVVQSATFTDWGMDATAKTEYSSSGSFSIPDKSREDFLLTMGDVNNMDFVGLKHVHHKSTTGKLAYMASIMEAMGLQIPIFCTSFALETVVFVIWMFELKLEAALLQLVLNIFFLVIFGTKVILSTAAYGKRYLTSFIFRLEISIVAMDTVSGVASVYSLVSPSRTSLILYFAFYAAFIFLHGVRIFYIFYATARPSRPSGAVYASEDASQSTASTTTKNTTTHIDSITGVWVSRTFQSMEYAMDDFVQSVSLMPDSPNFSLKLFATREKRKATQNPFASDNKNHQLLTGRPDWHQIMTQALEVAYETSLRKDTTTANRAVGVFFCGSPAIARVLQRTAQQVTAEHQYRHDGQSRCRVILHKENF